MITSAQIVPLAEMTDVKQGVSRYFDEIIRCVASQDWPAGCLVVSVAGEASERDEVVRSKVISLLGNAEEFIAHRISDVARDDPSIQIEDPRRLARMIVAVGQSLASKARAGGTKDQLHQLADDFVNLLF